jgi:hypothetical protein
VVAATPVWQARRAADGVHPSLLAMADHEEPAARIPATVAGSGAAPLRGRPMRLPRRRALATPRRDRSRIRSSSKLAMAANIVTSNLDIGSRSGRMSMPCVTAMKRTPEWIRRSYLTRSLYELSLSLYFDWLGPEQFGQHLVWDAQLNRKEWKQLQDEIAARRITEGWPQTAVDAMRTSINSMHELAGRVAGRARISPFRDFHEGCYSAFSSFAHQDFAAAAACGHVLETPTKETSFRDERNALSFLLQWADLAASRQK